MTDEPPSRPTESNKEAAVDEFSMIGRFFTQRCSFPEAWPSQGVGDDCAFLDVGATRIAVSADMMAQSTHFLDTADPYTVGRKALAVNLSDLAAAGSKPRAFFLSIALPKADEAWLERFSRGLFEESERYGCPLRGGDTTKSPVIEGKSKYTISITVMGELPAGRGLTRSGAAAGDDVWVSGTPGDAFAALSVHWGNLTCNSEDFTYFASRMDTPTPRVELGEALLNLASAAADISDGLAGDLGHILERSNVSAELDWAAMPRSEAMLRLTEEWQKRCVLSGGDDYELIFTASPDVRAQIEALDGKFGCRVTRIGRIVSGNHPLQVLDADGAAVELGSSFNHFA